MTFPKQLACRCFPGFLCALLAVGAPSGSLAAPVARSVAATTFGDPGSVGASSLPLLGPDRGDQMGRVLPPYASSIVDEPSLVPPVSPIEIDLSSDHDPKDFFNNSWRAKHTVTLPAEAALQKKRKHRNYLFATGSGTGLFAKLTTPAGLILFVLVLVAVTLTIFFVCAVFGRLRMQMRKTRRRRSGILRIADRRSRRVKPSKRRRSLKRRRPRPMPLMIADRNRRQTDTQAARQPTE